jgi:hypothetical protein
MFGSFICFENNRFCLSIGDAMMDLAMLWSIVCERVKQAGACQGQVLGQQSSTMCAFCRCFLPLCLLQLAAVASSKMFCCPRFHSRNSDLEIFTFISFFSFISRPLCVLSATES